MGTSILDIIHISDFHFTGSTIFDIYAYNKGAEMVNSMKADLVVSTGDLTERGLRGEYQLARSFFSQIEPEVFHLIGNHDARNVGADLFEEYFGERRIHKEGDNFVLLGYDSTIPDMNEGRFGELTIRELKADLESIPSGKIKIVAFHHHLLPIPKTGRERGIILDGGTVLELILDNEVDIVLNGHRHKTTAIQIENTVVSNAGTFSCEKLRSGDNHTFNTIKVYSNGKTMVRTHDIEGGTVQENAKYKKPKLVQPKGETILKIVHASDTHFTGGSEFNENIFRKAQSQINELEPDIFLHTGDITHNGLPEEIDIALDHLADIRAPAKLYTLGSHDMRHIGPEIFKERFNELMKIPPTGRLLLGDEYKSIINVYDSEKAAIAMINSSIYDSKKGLIGRRKLSIALDELSKIDSSKPKLVTFHHHIIPIPRTKEAELIEDDGNVLFGLVEAKVDMILTGHRHRTFSTQVEDTVIVNSNTLSSLRGVQKCRNSFNIIEITSDGVGIVKERCIKTGDDKTLGVYRLAHNNR